MKVVKLDPVNPDQDKLLEPAELIKNGELVAFPTETVYGLGADATSDKACLKIYEAKGRPPDNPLIVHINSFEMFFKYTDFHDERILKIMEEIWPGPITLVVKKRNIGDVPTSGLDTVAIRMPGHPIALKLIELSDRPIAAPSANISGRPSPTRASHVISDLGNRIPMIIDGGETFFGLESTVIQPVQDKIFILRPGPFSPEEIEEKFKMKVVLSGTEQHVPRAPGMKYRHYAPNKKLVIANDLDEIPKLYKENPNALVLCSKETAEKFEGNKYILGSRENLYEIAKNLFHSFRYLDQSDYSIGIIEKFQEAGIGYAIMNRIKKAASKN